jgi:hypothetical protein
MNHFKEKVYQEKIREIFKGVSDYHLPSGKIIDVLSGVYAIEVDFVSKWAESIGQSLQYAYESGKLPCIVFIYDEIENRILLNSVRPLLIQLNIKVFTMDNRTFFLKTFI